MDQQQYAQHMRRVMLNEAMKRIMDLTDTEVIDHTYGLVTGIDPNFKRSQFDRILREAMEPNEVDDMLGLSLDDPKEEIESQPDMSGDELEAFLMESFEELIQLFIEKPGAACILSFTYFDDDVTDENLNDVPLRGNQLAFGDEESIDNMLEVLTDSIIDSTQDGYVDTLGDPGDADDNLLGDISAGVIGPDPGKN